MGKWRTSILKARVTADDSDPSSAESILLFEIQVQLFESDSEMEAAGGSDQASNSSRQFKEGWFIYRSFKQFESLHQSLHEISSTDINNLFKKLPSLKKHMTGILRLNWLNMPLLSFTTVQLSEVWIFFIFVRSLLKL